MELKEFVMEIAKGIETRLENVKVIPTETLKNNGVVQHGVAIRMDEEKVSPILYVDMFFKKFKKGELTMPDIVKRVVSDYQDLPAHGIPDIDEWLGGDDLIDRIKIRLLNKKANEDMIITRKLVSYDIADTDLVALFYIEVVADDESVGDTGLTYYMLERFLPTISNEEELFNEVLSRITDDNVEFSTMRQVICGLVERADGDLEDIPIDDTKMFVLSNTKMHYGAFVILSEAARQKILEKIPSGMATILPSSVHELILLPTTEDEDIEELVEMVGQVNRTEVSEEQVLSNNVYHYDANTGKLTIAGSASDEVDV